MYPSGKYSAVIFDLDGTLLDTLADLTAAVNFAMRTLNCPERTEAEVSSFIGSGAVKLIERSLPQNDGRTDDALELFRRYYAEHCADHTLPFPGAEELIRRLRDRGIALGVLSNKLDEHTKHLCGKFFPGVISEGVSKHTPRKPDPTGLLHMIERLGCSPDKTLYVGDSENDRLVANNAGVECALVTWGFRKRSALEQMCPQKIVDSMAQLWDFILLGS